VVWTWLGLGSRLGSRLGLRLAWLWRLGLLWLLVLNNHQANR
jgi:hypothetical protein